MRVRGGGDTQIHTMPSSNAIFSSCRGQADYLVEECDGGLLLPQELANQGMGSFSMKLELIRCVSHRGEAVDFVEEDDGGLRLLGLLEQQAQLALRLPHPLAEDVGALAHEEGHLLPRLAGVRRQGPGHQRLARACTMCCPSLPLILVVAQAVEVSGGGWVGVDIPYLLERSPAA